MPVVTTDVNAEDTLEQGRQKINTTDEALAAHSNTLESQAAAHVAVGHPTLNYTKTEIDAQQAIQDAALTTHKASADHDGRYLAATYLASMVRTTLDQSIDGIKKFLKNIVVGGSDTPAVELHSNADIIMGKFRAAKSGTNNLIAVAIQDGGSSKDALVVTEGASAVNFPNHDVQAKGLKLATEDYVSNSIGNITSGGGGGFSQVLFNGDRIALEPSGSSAPGIPAWSESGIAFITKILLGYVHRTGINFIRMFCHFICDQEGTPGLVTVRLEIGAISTEYIFDPNNPNTDPTLILNVSSLAAGYHDVLYVRIKSSDLATTAVLSNVVILAEA